MKLRVELEIECAGDREGRALEATLSPDNKSIPRDQVFTAERDGSLLRFEVESSRPAAGLSSIASLLSDAKLFQDVWMTTS